MKKAIGLVFVLLITGCMSEEEQFSKDFKKFIAKEKTNEDQYEHFLLSSKIEYKPLFIDIEKEDSYSPHVIMTIIHAQDIPFQTIIKKELIIEDCKELAQIFHRYSKAISMQNNYYLYIFCYFATSHISYTFDVEKNELYLPKNYDQLVYLAKKYPIYISIDEVKSEPDGKKILCDIGYGEFRHGEYTDSAFADGFFFSRFSIRFEKGKFISR